MIVPDIPIMNASEDLLNRSSFANDLASVLVKYSAPTSFSIGLYGKWGSGKTSLLNMVLEAVEEQDSQAIIIRFNPWLCSDNRQLVSQFFKQLSSEIKIKSSASVTAWRIIEKYGGLFDATSVVPAVGPTIAAAGRVATSRAKIRVNEIDSNLQQQKDNIIKKLLEEKIKIIVAIDDIDRLSEEEIVAVFQLVKALADFPNTVYLLAFDYSTVVKALEKVQRGDGREYLEKIIQVPFQIPTPNMDSIYTSLFNKLDAIMNGLPENRWENQVWSELFHYGIKPYIKSLRDVVRFSNVFSLKYQLLADETNPVDLIGVSCLQVFEPYLYSSLPSIKHILCGDSLIWFSGWHEQQEELKSELLGVINSTETSNQVSVKYILGILFPHVKSILSLHVGGRDYDHKKMLLNRNIADSACFDRYFSLTLEDSAIPTSVISKMLFDMTDEELAKQIESFEMSGKITRVIDELFSFSESAQINSLPANRTGIVIETLLKYWETLTRRNENILHANSMRTSQLLVNLLKALPPERRGEMLLSVFQDEEICLPALTTLLDDIEEPHGLNSSKTVTEAEQLVPLETVRSLEQLFVIRASAAFDNWNKGVHYDRLEYLWKLEELVPEKQLRESINVSDNTALAYIVSICTSHGTNLLAGNSRFWETNRSMLEKYTPWEAAVARIGEYILTDGFFALPEDIQMDVVAFILSAKMMLEEKVEEKEISEERIRKELERLMREYNARHPKEQSP